MKTMIYTLAYAALLGTTLGSCNDDNAPVLTQKDWDNTATYFEPTDENMFGTYYKPQLGYVGDPMPFYDPQAGDFKIMYLQEYRPNQTTYHPFWAVSTKDGGSYTSLGELIPTGTEEELDAALGTGCTFYDEANKLYYTYYTGHTADTEVVMRATSTDFKTWSKDRTFFLPGSNDGYSRKDFRDPFIFESESGKYHMIVSTKKDGIGVLAEYTSTDLKHGNTRAYSCRCTGAPTVSTNVPMYSRWATGGTSYIPTRMPYHARYATSKAVRWTN